MLQTRFWPSLVCVLILSLGVAGCGVVTQEADWQTSPLETGGQTSPLAEASPLPGPTSTPTPVPTQIPTATPQPTPVSSRLVVLHTNDNWGETEPCG
jgi:hypothetical protein